MSNFIRANFCLKPDASPAQFYALLNALYDLELRYAFWQPNEVSGWLSSTDQEIAEVSPADRLSNPSQPHQFAEWLAAPGYMNIEMGWRLGGQVHTAYLSSRRMDFSRPASVLLSVDEHVFFKPHSVYYSPDGDIRFEVFKQALRHIALELKPRIGAVDMEADLYCGEAGPEMFKSVASWGNYYSQAVLDHWAPTDVATLLATVDEAIRLDGAGVLTFIHPLAANQNWTPRHEMVDALLRRNPISW